jgi:hypothetical protein
MMGQAAMSIQVTVPLYPGLRARAWPASAPPVVAGLPDRLAHSRHLLIAIAIALTSVGLVIAYATLLSRSGMAASTPALLAVLLAATLSSIAGFAFSSICGAMLLQMMSDPVQVVEMVLSAFAPKKPERATSQIDPKPARGHNMSGSAHRPQVRSKLRSGGASADRTPSLVSRT